MTILAIHTIFGYSWDELAAIIAIIATICGFAYWLTTTISKRNDKSRKKNVYIPLANIQKSVKKFGTELHKHSEVSSKTLIHLKDRENYFDRRISTLENFKDIVTKKLHL